MRRFFYVLAVALVALAVPSCNIFNDIGNAECASANGCAPPVNTCGDNGSGGDDGSGGGSGGSDTGSGADTSGLGGGSTGTGTGTGTESGTDTGTSTDTGEAHHERRPRRRWRGGLGTAVQADCPGATPATCAAGEAAIGTAVSDAASGNTYTICGGVCSAECLAIGIGTYTPTLFKFTTTIAPNPKTKPGGWQVASASLRVWRWTGLLPEEWWCPPIWVGMPVQTEAAGLISPQVAANLSAESANAASNILRDYPQGVFCSLLASTMTTWFTSTQPMLGARVTKVAQ